MSKSNYLENAILNHMFGGPDYVRPATFWLALFTSSPTDAGGGTEVEGGNYERVAIPNDSSNWPPATGGVKANGLTLTFNIPSAAWGHITHFALFDPDEVMLRYGALSVPKTVNPGDMISFAPGALTFSED